MFILLLINTLCWKHPKPSNDEQEYLKPSDNEPVYLEIPEGLENGIGCSICKHFVFGIESILTNTTIQSKIIEYGKKVCSRFPSIGRRFCNQIIEYIPNIMEYLSEGLTNSEICAKLKICNSNDVNNDDSYLELYLEMEDSDYITEFELPLGISNDDLCEYCKWATGYTHSLSMSNSLNKNTAIASCSALSGNAGLVCKSIISTSYGMIQNSIATSFNPASLCIKIGFCRVLSSNDFDAETNSIQIPTGLKETYCSTCRSVVSSIRNMISGTIVQARIPLLPTKICSMLHQKSIKQRQVCRSIVKRDIAKIIQYHNNGLSISKICSNLGYC
ncbi:proactivator polypeptide-like [Histomonas meleagridis]|uniref:proactivator polypeptide-like n=1 Tax=Histomonas meleagridis TaxID=135588 RepID=UPI00355AC5FE|nr:proactivator polypeptide-like [Histomonas meleagridis]KAH0796676.1 proactivator polypeptide-like [Histomonas meleagridis]